MWRRLACAITIVSAAACGTPTAPPVPPPPVVGPATPPVIRSIAVPTTRVEAGQSITITAVVEDAETPLSELTYTWSASAGTIVGNGMTAAWQMPPGITSGVDVAVSLTVIDTYDAVSGGTVIKRQFTVTGSAPAFRVHDSEAEVRELGRRFLIDLFGNSAVPAEDCMVDFADECATLPEGRNDELQQVIAHRQNVIVDSAILLAQRVAWHSQDFGSVHSAVLYNDRIIGASAKPPTCGDFELTVIYARGRWWLCQSFFNRDDTSHCPASLDNAVVSQLLRGRNGGSKVPGVIR